MALAWRVHGVCMVCAWRWHGVGMALAWRWHGVGMACLQGGVVSCGRGSEVGCRSCSQSSCAGGEDGGRWSLIELVGRIRQQRVIAARTFFWKMETVSAALSTALSTTLAVLSAALSTALAVLSTAWVFWGLRACRQQKRVGSMDGLMGSGAAPSGSSVCGRCWTGDATKQR